MATGWASNKHRSGQVWGTGSPGNCKPVQPVLGRQCNNLGVGLGWYMARSPFPPQAIGAHTKSGLPPPPPKPNLSGVGVMGMGGVQAYSHTKLRIVQAGMAGLLNVHHNGQSLKVHCVGGHRQGNNFPKWYNTTGNCRWEARRC